MAELGLDLRSSSCCSVWSWWLVLKELSQVAVSWAVCWGRPAHWLRGLWVRCPRSCCAHLQSEMYSLPLSHLAARGTAFSSLSGQKCDKIFGIQERCFTINAEMFLQTTGYCLNHISVESFVFKTWPHITRCAFLAFSKSGFFPTIFPRKQG